MMASRLDEARAHYRSLALQSEVERAEPHRLVLMLYDELVLCIDVLAVRSKAGARLTDDPQAHRARDILLALRSGLDFESAASLAHTLDGLYVALAAELETRLASADPAGFGELRAAVETVREAWRSIGC